MLASKLRPFHRKQLNAMIERAEDLQTLISQDDWPGLHDLLDRFAGFAKGYDDLLEQCPDEISNHRVVLATGIDRLLQEWDILSRACEQRNGPEKGSDLKFKRYLQAAEKSLRGYCDRWHPPGGSTEYSQLHDPVVYFEKLYGISRAPCAPEIPIVSVPLTDYDAPDRWQALAHELGHHIYWNALTLQALDPFHADLREAVSRALDSATDAQRVQLWQTWLEEIFADVCGTLLIGPAYALSSQEVEADRIDEKADLGYNDGQHPCAYLRPLIPLEVLRQIAEHHTQPRLKAALLGDGTGQGLLGKLETRWLNLRQIADGLKVEDTGDGLKVEGTGIEATLKQLAADVSPIIRAILDAPVWPQQQNLWSLIDFYGKQQQEADIQAATNLAPEALRAVPDTLPDLTTLTVPEPTALPASVMSLWTYLSNLADKTIQAGQFKKEQKTLVVWQLLLELGVIESFYFMFQVAHPHTQTFSHLKPWHSGCLREHSHARILHQ